MKYLLFAILSIKYLAAISQSNDFATVGAVWHYSVLENPGFPDMGYIKLESVKDTILNSNPSKRLFQSSVTSMGTKTFKTFYLRSDSGKVFYWAKNGFHLLYDFNLAKGDSFTIRKPFEYYGIPFSSDSVFKVHIDSVGFKIINNDSLKVLYFKQSPDDEWKFDGNYFMEKIGNFSYILPQWNLKLKDNDLIQGLSCYSDNKISLIESIPCDKLVTKISNNFRLENIKFTNPIDNIFIIESTKTINKLEFIDLFGVSISEFGNIHDFIFSSDINIKPGLYILKVSFFDGTVKLINVIKI